MISAYFPLDDKRFKESFGLFFNDLKQGQRFSHRPGVTLSQQENVDESLDTLNGAMLHFDAHYAGQTVWKRPLLVSTLTIRRALGMTVKTFGRRRRILSFDEIAMTGPLFGGDTIYSESEVLGLRAGDGPETGVAAIRTSVLKPDGAVVGRLHWDGEFWRRGFGPDAELGQACTEPRFAAYAPDKDGRLIEQQGLFFEDFTAGETFVHFPRRSFLEHEVVEQVRRAVDIDPAYSDLARRGDAPLRVPETTLVGVATALTTRTFGRVVANLGWTNVRFLADVAVGDTVEARSTIAAKRESKSRPDEGVLTVDTTLANQNAVDVLSFRRNLLVYRRSGAPYAAAGY